MDLLLRKSGGRFALLAKDYELLYQGSIYGDLSFYNWKYAEFFIDQNQYVIRSDEKAKWLLEQNGGSIACCKRNASGPKLEFAIEFDDLVWRFKPNRNRLMLGHDIWEKKLKIGRSKPKIKFWWPEIEATFNQIPRLEIASFAIWVRGIHWAVAGQVTAARAEIGI